MVTILERVFSSVVFLAVLPTTLAALIGIAVTYFLHRRGVSRRQVDQLRNEQADLAAEVRHLKAEITVYLDGLPDSGPAVRDPFKKGLESIKQHSWTDAVSHFRDAAKHASEREVVALHNLIGICYYSAGRFRDALISFGLAVERARLADDAPGLSAALGNEGLIYCEWGQHGEALRCFEEASELHRKMHSTRLLAQDMGNLGATYQRMGLLKDSMRYHKKALAMYRRSRCVDGVADQLCEIGRVSGQKGELVQSQRSFEKALDVSLRAKYVGGTADARSQIARMYLDRCNLEKALEWFEQALRVVNEMGHQQRRASVLSGIGDVHDRRDEVGEALSYHEQALKIYKNIGYVPGIAEESKQVGLLQLSGGEPTKAIEPLLLSHELYQQMDMPSERHSVFRYLTVVCRRVGRDDFGDWLATNRGWTRERIANFIAEMDPLDS